MMLAMMIAALSFTACGDDEEDGNNTSSLTITKDGKTKKDRYNDPGTCKKESDKITFFIGLDPGDFHFYFPLNEYGEDFQLSSLYVGFNDFPVIHWRTYETLNFYYWDCDYLSGSVTVTENNNQYVSVRFDQYHFIATNDHNDVSHDFTFNGTIKFLKI